MTITLTIEDDPISGNPTATMSFDPPVTRADFEDPTPAHKIAMSLLAHMKDHGATMSAGG